MRTIREATQGDKGWVGALYDAERRWLGSVFNSVWWRYWHRHNPHERWIVIEPFAFAHYNIRKDGWRTLYEIAVAPIERGHGMGRRLVEYIGPPMRLKTDTNNPESTAFYEALGFRRTGQTASKDGSRQLGWWEWTVEATLGEEAL